MLGVGTMHISDGFEDKYVFISHLLMNLNIPNLSFNTVDKSIHIPISRFDELNMARVQGVFNYASTDSNIQVKQRKLNSNNNIIYCMTFNSRKAA